MGLALGPPRLPDPDRDVPCRPGAALLAKRPHLRETEATPDNASWIAAWSVAPPWGAWGRSHAGQAFSRDLKHQRDRAGVVPHQAEPPGFRMQKPTPGRPEERRTRPHPAPASDNYFVGRRSDCLPTCGPSGFTAGRHRKRYKRSATAAR